MDMGARVEWEAGVAVGDQVRAKWGHGESARAEGVAEVVKVNAKSYRVRWVEDVEAVQVYQGVAHGTTTMAAGTEVTVARVANANWTERGNAVEPA